MVLLLLLILLLFRSWLCEGGIQLWSGDVVLRSLSGAGIVVSSSSSLVDGELGLVLLLLELKTGLLELFVICCSVSI